jgi:hypothetical protein
MASLIYNNMFDKWARGGIDFDTDSFKVLLTTSGYTENKDTHTFRSDVTSEVANGNGYTTGGTATTVSLSLDTANDRLDITFAQVTWPASTITARKAVYYKARGGAATADELIFVNDFGSDVSTTSGTFTLNASTVRIQN